MKIAVVIILCLIAALGWIRLAPSDPARWHVDPLEAPPPGVSGVLMRPAGGDFAGPVFAAPPEVTLAAFDQRISQLPRISRLAGSVEAGHVTYVVRSRLFGFPDYISVRAVPDGAGSTLAVFSRLRFGLSDMGVNRARLERWLDGFQPAS
ncbi:MAG: DUF1499 domain-containing protein [Pseudomonadota bacterium]